MAVFITETHSPSRRIMRSLCYPSSVKPGTGIFMRRMHNPSGTKLGKNFSRSVTFAWHKAGHKTYNASGRTQYPVYCVFEDVLKWTVCRDALCVLWPPLYQTNLTDTKKFAQDRPRRLKCLYYKKAHSLLLKDYSGAFWQPSETR